MSTHTRALTEATFDDTVAKGTVVIDFWAEWCGPCRAFAPIYEAVASAHPDVVFAKVDTEEEEGLGQRFEVESIPTLMVFRDGQVVHRSAGAMPRGSLEALVNRVKLIETKAYAASQAAAEASRKGVRPKGVPAEATWDEAESEWCLGPVDADGAKHGLWRYWRPDGTLCNEANNRHGKPHGPFKRFHENGQVSNTGQFEDGMLHGTRAWIACDGAFTTERMHEGGVSDKVRRTEMDYDHDRVVAIRHYNAAGQRCLPATGEPYPERPKGVSEQAEFVEQAEQWQHLSVDTERENHGLSRAWTSDGRLLWEGEFVHGTRHGRWVEECKDEFTDERAATLHGVFEGGRPVGTWSVRDAAGKVLFTRDLGVATDPKEFAASPVAQNVAMTAEEWRGLAKEYLGQRKNDLGLLALVRAAITSRSHKSLDEAIKRMCMPRNDDSAGATAENLTQDDPNLQDLALAMLQGGHPGALLQKAAQVTDDTGYPRLALDCVNAAMLLYPLEHGLNFTRGLILMSLGLDRQARIDAEALVAHGLESGVYLQRSIAAYFPTFGFWPKGEQPTSTMEGLPEGPAQPLVAVQRLVQVYATRLMACREAVLRRFKPGAPLPWLPPDLTRLLPAGPVALETETLPPPDDEEEGIELDETLDVDVMGLRQLMRTARGDWSALCWLVWAVGMDDVGLPKRLAPREAFGQAAGMASQRLWRARDRRATRRTFEDHQVPGFNFIGVDVDQLPPQVVAIAEDEYAEVQAMFHWLTDAEVRSPFQDNLRGS